MRCSLDEDTAEGTNAPGRAVAQDCCPDAISPFTLIRCPHSQIQRTCVQLVRVWVFAARSGPGGWQSKGDEKLFDRGPTLVRIVCGSFGHSVCCVVAEIILIDVAVLIDHKGHDAANSVVRRIGEQSEAASQFSVIEIAFRPARRVGSMSLEQFVGVTVIGVLCRNRCIPRLRRRQLQGPKDLRLPGSYWPIEAVLFTGTAGYLLRVGSRSLAVVSLCRVLLLVPGMVYRKFSQSRRQSDAVTRQGFCAAISWYRDGL